MYKTLIGHVTITKHFEHTQYYEVAAWYTLHEVQPGTYPVHCTWRKMNADGPWSADLIALQYDTVITKQYLPSLLAGVPVGSASRDNDRVGQRATASFSIYSYQCPAELADDSAAETAWFGGIFRPAPGVQFRACINDGRRYGTKPVHN